MATPGRTQTSQTVKVPSEVLKKNRVDVEKRKKAEQAVMADRTLVKYYGRDKARQDKANKSALELWWERGKDVISIRRSSAAKTEDESDVLPAGVGQKSVTLLAYALGLEPRAFNRAADFALLFNEDDDKREKFFSKLSRDHGAENVPTWTHVEVMLKEVAPSHKDKLDELYPGLLSTVASEGLSVRAFSEMLKRRFRANRPPKRRMDARQALKSFELALIKTVETLGQTSKLAVDAIGDDPSEIVDPQAILQALQIVLSKVGDTAALLSDAEQQLLERSRSVQAYVASLTPSAPPAGEASVPDVANPSPADGDESPEADQEPTPSV